jgi:RNA polymerase sigma-70 factor (ECF subfamily)
MNEKEFQQLISENKSAMWRLCRLYAPDSENSKDLFQDVLIQIWQSMSSFRAESNISTWIYRITVNTGIRYMLKMKKYDDHLSLDEFEIYMQEQPEDIVHDYEALYICIARLNEVDRTLTGLFLEDLPYKEIADVMGITENNVGVKISRIKKSLALCIGRANAMA